MMLASSKFLLTFSCLVGTLFLYTNNHFSASSRAYAVAPSNTSEATIIDPQPKTPQAAPSNNPPATPQVVPEDTNHTRDVSKEKQTRILQATMMFGDKFDKVNERTLQSHVDHAKRWGYGNHILKREIVGAGQWDKFIFGKLLHVLDLIIGELKKPREERAEWVVWYDADTLILNPNVHWELFLPPDAFPDIHFMATKNVDGFNAGLFFFRVHEWSVEILSDAFSLRRLRPEIDISGNIEQNAMKHLFGEEPNKEHIIYQPQSWYNGFHGAERAQTEINGGDMLVHFAGINHDGEGQTKKEVMSQWFEKIEQRPDEWQVPLEETKYPREIEAFWRTYKEGKEMLDTVRIRPDVQSGPSQDVKSAKDELKWAIEELAYDAANLKKRMEEMAQALKAAKKPQVTVGSDGLAEQQAFWNDGKRAGSASGGQGRFSDIREEHLATGTEVTAESDPGSQLFESNLVT